MDKKEQSTNKWEMMNELGIFVSNIDKQVTSYKQKDNENSEIADESSEVIIAKNYYAYNNIGILENIDEQIKKLKKDIERFDKSLAKNNIKVSKKMKIASYLNRLTQAKTSESRLSIANEEANSITRIIMCANNMRKLTDELVEDMNYAQIALDKIFVMLNNPCILHYENSISKNKLLDYINIDNIKNMIDSMHTGVSYGNIIVCQGKEKLALFKKTDKVFKILISDLIEDDSKELISAAYDKDKIIEMLSCTTKKSVLNNIQNGIKYNSNTKDAMQILVNMIVEVANKEKGKNSSKAAIKKDDNSITEILIALKSIDVSGNFESYPNLMRLDDYRYIKDTTDNNMDITDIIEEDLKNNTEALKLSATGCTENGEMIYKLELNI